MAGLINNLAGFVNALSATQAGQHMLDNMANLLADCGDNIVLVKQAQVLSSLSKDKQLGFVAASVTSGLDIKPLVQDLLVSDGAKVNKGLTMVVNHLQNRYDQSINGAEKLTILAHLQNAKGLVAGNTAVNLLKQAIIDPVRVDKNGKPLDADAITKVINTAVQQRENMTPISATTSGDHF